MFMKTPYLLLFCVLFYVRLASQTCTVNCNGSFDTPTVTASVGLTTSIACWSTTASDGNMEIWGNGFAGVPSYGGAQFVELNATQAATMYQAFSVTSGVPLSIGFAHRGRSGLDTVEVAIGPVGGPFTILGRWGDGNTAWGYHTTSYTPTSTAVYQIRFTPVYWTGGNVAIGNFFDALSVTAPISISVTASSTTLCAGTSVTLVAAGATSYTWSTGSTSPTLVVTPTTTATYSVLGVSGGCNGSGNISLTVAPQPTVAVSGSTLICSGTTVTLSATGATSYTWSTASNASSIVVSPSSTTGYSLTGISGLCSSTSVHNLSVNPTPTIAINGNNAICLGNTATLSASGAFSYTWNPGSLTGSLVSVSPPATTIYTITGTGTGGCSSSVTRTLTVNSIPSIAVTVPSQSICPGTSTLLTATGGVSYTWTPGPFTGNPFSASPLSNSIYTVTGRSAAGCTAVATSTVRLKAAPALTFNTFSITCASLGSATVFSSGGVGPFSYTWMPGAQTGSVANNLNPNTYTISTLDAGTGCTTSSTTIFTSLIPLTANLSNTGSLTCNGAQTGTASFSGISGGSASQNYSWTNGPLSYLTPSVNSLSGGTWSATITDALTGCKVFSVFTITQPPPITLSILPSSPVNCASVNIVLTATASGGTPGYNYTWTAGPVSSSTSVTYVAAGISGYTVDATDSFGCIAQKSITASFVPTISITSNGPRCNGDNLTLTGNGGASYFWTGPPSFTSASQNPGIAIVGTSNGGIYNLTVTALNGCSSSSNTAVVVNPTPTLTASGSTVCTIQTLSLYATSVAGAGYQWNGPLGFNSTQQNVTFSSPLTGHTGIYTVVATSPAGCTNTAFAQVNVIPPPNLVVSLSSNSMCAQALNGSPVTIALNSAGASSYTLSTPAHIFNSNTSGPSTLLSTLPPFLPTGVAVATIQGSNGVCTVSTSALFTIVPNPTVTISSPAPVICAGQSFTYNSSGAGSYSWSSNNPNNFIISNGNVAVSNPTTNSIFSVMGSSLGCISATNSMSMTVNPLPQLTVNPNPAITCLGNPILLTAGGTGTLYNWYPNLFLSAGTGTAVYAKPTTDQNYIVVSSLNNCTISAVITVSVLPLPTAIISAPKNAVCLNDNITMFGGADPLSVQVFRWTGPLNLDLARKDLSLKAYAITASGVYTLTVTDQNNCSGSTTQSIAVLDLPTGFFDEQALTGCEPYCPSLVFKPGPASSPITSLKWELLDLDYSGIAFKHCFDLAGTYTINGEITDTNNCVNKISATVRVNPKPAAEFSSVPLQPVENTDEVEFTNQTRGEQQKQWRWYFINNQGYRSDKKNTSYMFQDAGNFPVAMVVTNTWGCSDSIVKIITVDPDFSVFIPNTFTPNDDGRNELFGPVLHSIKEMEFAVFDRWGQVIFSTRSTDKGWDGTFKGKPCMEGTYAWKLHLKTQSSIPNQKEKFMTGHVLLMR